MQTSLLALLGLSAVAAAAPSAAASAPSDPPPDFFSPLFTVKVSGGPASGKAIAPVAVNSTYALFVPGDAAGVPTTLTKNGLLYTSNAGVRKGYFMGPQEQSPLKDLVPVVNDPHEASFGWALDSKSLELTRAFAPHPPGLFYTCAGSINSEHYNILYWGDVKTDKNPQCDEVKLFIEYK